MKGGGFILALIVAAVAGLLFADLALKATDNFGRHTPKPDGLAAANDGEIPAHASPFARERTHSNA